MILNFSDLGVNLFLFGYFLFILSQLIGDVDRGYLAPLAQQSLTLVLTGPEDIKQHFDSLFCELPPWQIAHHN